MLVVVTESKTASTKPLDDVAVVSPDAPRRPGWLRLVLVSDTHNVDLPSSCFPPGDLLVHAGDHTADGLGSELVGAAAWLRSLAPHYTHGVVAIAGNHDKPLDVETWLSAAPHSQPGETWTDASMSRVRALYDDGPLGHDARGSLRLLHHSDISVGGLRMFGSPYVGLTPKRQAMTPDDPRRCEGFVRDHARLEELYAAIPANLDVLVTHGPPLGILDSSVQYGGVQRPTPIAIGSRALRDRLLAMKPTERPRLHVFGHEHDARGFVCDEELGCIFVNAAAVDGDRGIVAKGGGYSMKEGFRPFVVDVRVRASSAE